MSPFPQARGSRPYPSRTGRVVIETMLLLGTIAILVGVTYVLTGGFN